MAKLKRDAGTGVLPVQDDSSAAGMEAPTKEGAGMSRPDWDTPVARELRGKIRTLEREARKREAVLKVGGKMEGLSLARGGGILDIMHDHSRMNKHPGTPTMLGRSTSGFHSPNRQMLLLAPSAKRLNVFGESHEG